MMRSGASTRSQDKTGGARGSGLGSARGSKSSVNPPSPGSPNRAGRGEGGGRRAGQQSDSYAGSAPMSRVSSLAECKKDDDDAQSEKPVEDERGLFHVIEQLAALEGALYSILDGLKCNATHVSFFCREYWGTSASQAQLSLERLSCNERLKRQVQQACVLESLSLAVVSHLCSGIMQNVSVTIRSRLRNLLYYIHENCLVLLDLVCQRWLAENPPRSWESERTGHCPENLNLDILIRVKRYRRLRKGEHIMALRQQNEMIANVVRQLCRGAASKRPPLSSRSMGSPPGDRTPGARGGAGNSSAASVLSVVSDVLASRTPLDRLRACSIRSKMLQYMRFKPLLNIDGNDPDCPWPMQDPYERYGADQFAQDGPPIWFELLPPMLPNLELNPKLPPLSSAWGPEAYTLVLDLDETLVHYFECDGLGNYDIRPGMQEFLPRMSSLGYELVIFTAATQDYADWVIDQIDPDRLIHHRLYRQHALPWGPIFVKDLSRLGRDLDRLLIIDNVQENFMLQPHNGIFIYSWYDDPHDTALFGLTPFLEELITTKAKVPEILDKYRHQIPSWAGFDQYEVQGESDFDQGIDDGFERVPLEPIAGKRPPVAPGSTGPLSPADTYGSQQVRESPMGGFTPSSGPPTSASTTATSLRTSATTTGTTTAGWSEASSAIQSVRQEVSPPPSPPVPGLGAAAFDAGTSSVASGPAISGPAGVSGYTSPGMVSNQPSYTSVASDQLRQEWEGINSGMSSALSETAVNLSYSGTGPSVSSSYVPQRVSGGGYPQAQVQPAQLRPPQQAFSQPVLPQQPRPQQSLAMPIAATQAQISASPQATQAGAQGPSLAGQVGPQRNVVGRPPQMQARPPQAGPQRTLMASNSQAVDAAAQMRSVPARPSGPARPPAPTFSSASGPFQAARPQTMQMQSAAPAIRGGPGLGPMPQRM